MPLINATAFDSFAVAARERFVDDFLPVLRREFPEMWVGHTDAELRDFLDDQCDYAAQWNVATARGIYLLLGMRVRLGRDFPTGDRHGWAREILARRTLSEDERLDVLEATVWGAAA